MGESNVEADNAVTKGIMTIVVTVLLVQGGWMIKLSTDVSRSLEFISSHLRYHQREEEACREARSMMWRMLRDHEDRLRSLERG